MAARVNLHPNHILIEGDNLHALTCLTYTHSNKVDVILPITSLFTNLNCSQMPPLPPIQIEGAICHLRFVNNCDN